MTSEDLLEYLEKNALWIIMDPWETSPNPIDNYKCPDLDKLNQEVLLRIVDYIPKLTHVLVSCPVYESKRQVKLNPLIKHISNINHNFELLQKYVERYKIQDIVYIGFHHGRCILTRRVGARAISEKIQHINLYIKKDMTLTLPWDTEEEADEKSLRFAKLI